MVCTLSVVVPATDVPRTLPRCRAALASATAAVASPVEIVEVTTPSELSASGARNAGVARSSGDVIVFVDADVEIHPDALARIHDAFDADPDLTALFGSYDDAPADPSTVSAFRNLLHHHVHHRNPGPADTFWTGLGAIRRSAFLATGGFDEVRYPYPSIEDIELGSRVVRDGGRIELDPRIQGTHLKMWTLRSMVHTDFARRALPWIALQMRDQRVSSSLNLSWRHRSSAAASALLVVAAVIAFWHVPVAAAVAVGSLALIVSLNAGLYRLLASRLGLLRGGVGIGLHVVHHLVAVAALPVGVVLGVISRRQEAAPSVVLTIEEDAA